MSARCETCRFCVVRQLKVTLDGELTGDTLPDPECRRNPPGFYMNDDWSGSVWPSVKATDWCGEYEPLESASPGPSWCGEPINEMSEQRLRETREEMRATLARQFHDEHCTHVGVCDPAISMALLLVNSRLRNRDRDGAEGGDANAAPVPQDRQARAGTASPRVSP